MPEPGESAAPRICPDCGLHDGTLRRAPAPWFITWAPSLCVLLLAVFTIATHWKPGRLARGGSGLYSTIAFTGPGLGSVNFLGESHEQAMTVAEVRALAEAATGATLAPVVLDRGRGWGLPVPDRRLQVGTGTREGLVFTTGTRGIAGLRGKSYEQRTYDDAPGRAGPQQPENYQEWSHGFDSAGTFSRTQIKTHSPVAPPAPGPAVAAAPAATVAQWSVTASPGQAWVVALACSVIVFAIARTLGVFLTRFKPVAVVITALILAFAAIACYMIADSRTAQQRTVTQASAPGTTFADTSLSEQNLAQLMESPNPDAALAKAMLDALPPRTLDSATIIYRWRERGPTKFQGFVLGADDWIAILGVNNSLAPDGTHLPTPSVPTTFVFSDDSASVFIPTPEGSKVNLTFTLYLFPAACLVLIIAATWYVGVILRAAWITVLTKSRRTLGACVRCAYPLPTH